MSIIHAVENPMPYHSLVKAFPRRGYYGEPVLLAPDDTGSQMNYLVSASGEFPRYFLALEAAVSSQMPCSQAATFSRRNNARGGMVLSPHTLCILFSPYILPSSETRSSYYKNTFRWQTSHALFTSAQSAALSSGFYILATCSRTE